MIKAERNRSIQVELSDKEDNVLGELAKAKGMTRSALMRQALRVYQALDRRTAEGGTLHYRKPDGTFEPFEGIPAKASRASGGDNGT